MQKCLQLQNCYRYYLTDPAAPVPFRRNKKNIQHVFIKTDRGEPYRTRHGCRPGTGRALGKAGSAGMKKCPEVHGRLTRGLRAAVSYCFSSPVTRFSRSCLLSQEGTESRLARLRGRLYRFRETAPRTSGGGDRTGPIT